MASDGAPRVRRRVESGTRRPGRRGCGSASFDQAAPVAVPSETGLASPPGREAGSGGRSRAYPRLGACGLRYDEERAAAFPAFKIGRSVFLNRDVVAIEEYIRRQEEPVVDIQAVFGLPADPELQGPAGVHPSLAGQKAIARAFVERLTL
jgi:hypothetical protein